MNGFLCYFVTSQFSSSCVMGYTIFHGALLIERVLRTFLVSNRFQWLQSVVVGLMVICLLTLPNVYQYTLSYPSEPLYNRFYCHSPSLLTSNIKIRALQKALTFLICDCCVTVGDVIANIVFLNKLDGSSLLMEILGREIVNFMRTFSIFLIAGSQLLYYHVRRKETAEWLNSKSLTATETYFEMFRKQLN
ncbi:hypothetical protein M3Y96_00550500 [Aphelenchoides besseyi]|nr:hypothetical protein M3Y96_00550500 [Aphelenchoides besseyi]